MATALRCLARVAARDVLLAPAAGYLKISAKQIHARNSPYIKDIDISKLPEFETSNDPSEWSFVENLLPGEIVPPLKKIEGPTASGYTAPQPEKALKNPYFINRTKNHMQPVYLTTSDRGDKQVTLIRYIDGNIWQLEKDIRAFLETKHRAKYLKTHKFYVSKICSRINEMSRQIRFKGDHVALVKMWMDEKGF